MGGTFSHRVLSIFKYPKTMQSVMRELSKDENFSEEYSEHFLFAEQSRCQRGFGRRQKKWSILSERI